MRNRLLAALLATAMIIQNAGTVMAADNADLGNNEIYAATEASSDEASVEVSIEDIDDPDGTHEDDDELSVDEEKPKKPAENTEDESVKETSTQGAGESSSEASSEASDETSYEVSMTEELPDDFYTEHPTGLVNFDTLPDIESINDLSTTGRKLLRSASYPAKYITPGLPDLKDQGSYGTCWAFATVGLAEINLIKNGYPGYDLSEVHLAYFNYRNEVDPLGGTEGDYASNLEKLLLKIGGNMDAAANTLMTWSGFADESVADYATTAAVANTGTLDPSIAYEDKVRITGFYEERYTKDDNTPVKRLIMDYGAVGASYWTSNSMSNVTKKSLYNYSTNAYYNPERYATNHAVVIVGWDDNFSADNFIQTPPGDGAWLVRNSWTTGYEESYSGYFWMSYYEASLRGLVYALECKPVEGSYDNNYQYDAGLYSSHPDMYAVANVFTAAGEGAAERLEAVSFDTGKSNANYEISIYTDLESADDPESGTLATVQRGTTGFAGKYEIPLDTPVILQKGQTFSVVITQEKSGKIETSIARESQTVLRGDYNDIDCNVASKEGQSFFRRITLNDPTPWITEGGSRKGNFRIKAYTQNIDSFDEVAVTDISFDNIEDGKYTIGVNRNYKVLTSVTPSNATGKKVTWSSSDPSICAVSEYGVLTGINPGTAVITASVDENVSASFEVTVRRSITKLTIVKTDDSVHIGKTTKFNLTHTPSDVPLENVTWKCLDTSVAVVNSDGEVTGLKAGKTTIVAEADGKKATYEFTVWMPFEDLKLEATDNNTVMISWKPINGAVRYYINRGSTRIADLDATVTEFTDDYYADQLRESSTCPSYTFIYEMENKTQYSLSTGVWLKRIFGITYVIGDKGTQNSQNPDRYTYGKKISLYDAVPAEGYTFDGWYLDENFKTRKSTIESYDSGKKVLYAKFIEKEKTNPPVVEEDEESEITPPVDVKDEEDEITPPTDDKDEENVSNQKSKPYSIELCMQEDQDLYVGSTVHISAVVKAEEADKELEDDSYVITYTCKPDTNAVEGAAAAVVATGDTKPVLAVTGKRFGRITVTATSNAAGNDGEKLSVSKTFMILEIQPKKVTISPATGSSADHKVVTAGQTLVLTSSVAPENADQNVVWVSSDEKVATVTVTEEGAKVTATAPGTAYISAISQADASVRGNYRIVVSEDGTASDSGKELRITGTAKNAPLYGSSSDDASLQFEKLEIAAGKSFALKAVLMPADAFTAKGVTWASGNSAVATINAQGKITAKSAGSTVITATSEDGNLVAACRVSVYAPVTSLVLDKKTLKLGRGQSDKLNVTTILPVSASDEVSFASSNSAIVRVDGSGNITAGDINGTADITVKTAHGEKTAKCKVTVGNPVNSIKVTAKGGATSLAAGKTLQLSAVFNDGDKALQPLNKSVNWEIVDGSEFASINEKGVLTGLHEGNVTVMAVSTTDQVDESKLGTVTIAVYVPVKKAVLNVEKIDMVQGSSFEVALELTTANGDAPTGQVIGSGMKYVYATSGDSGLECVNHNDGTYTVTATGAAGKTATFYAMYTPYGSQYTAYKTCTINILDTDTKITSIGLNRTSLDLSSGAIGELSAVLAPMALPGNEVVWTVSDRSALCFVDENGNPVYDSASNIAGTIRTGSAGSVANKVRVKALPSAKADGKYYVEAMSTARNKHGYLLTASCTVNIKGAASFVRIKSGKEDKTSGELSLAKGKNVTLKAFAFTDSAMKQKAANQKVTWKSDDPKVATVTASGKVVATGIGSTRIWAESTDVVGSDEKDAGGHSLRSAAVTVNVYAPITKLTLDKSKVSMTTMVGSTTRYSSFSHYEVVTAGVPSADFYGNPGGAGSANNKVTWTSNSSNIKAYVIDTDVVSRYKNSYDKQNLLSVYGEDYVDISGGKTLTTGAGQSLAIVAEKPGTVKLTASAGGKKAVCTITVYAHVTGLAIGQGRISAFEMDGCDYSTTLSLTNKKEKTVSVVPQLEIAGVAYSIGKKTAEEKAATAAYNAVKKLAVNTSVNYRSSNPSVASVNAKGVIIAKSAGTAIVTVSTADGSFTRRILVVVN